MEPFATGRFAEVSPRQVAAVRSAADFARLVTHMREDLGRSGKAEWENATLDRYLEALAAVAEDRGPEGRLSWAELADLVVTATGYE
ncbi:hypothetical protein DQ244_05955 [Blastococcus sp. TBT05-19]|uniref:DUF7660 family protein n=1 Tax=Blastococcus sp. TBT05-19 TaxID=2250581 RepID=UPI000DE90005|nr:hypothetical protein [Blastococcus sp. TBT05-19]RBY94805.1 hypothetical protein DQ244_05955 [Blastococcus sp. TBT05-19]